MKDFDKWLNEAPVNEKRKEASLPPLPPPPQDPVCIRPSVGGGGSSTAYSGGGGTIGGYPEFEYAGEIPCLPSLEGCSIDVQTSSRVAMPHVLGYADTISQEEHTKLQREHAMVKDTYQKLKNEIAEFLYYAEDDTIGLPVEECVQQLRKNMKAYES